MKSKGVVVTACMLVLWLVTGCGRQGGNTVRVGAILPLTGDTASYGKNAQNGIDLAVAEINQAGGIDGKELSVVYEDDKGQASEAVNIMQKMVSVDLVPVVMGSAGSSVTLAMCPLANENKVVLISPISSSKELTTKGGKYFFRICPSDAFQSRILADWIWKKGFKTVGLIYVNNSWGIGLKDEFVSSYSKLGGLVLRAEGSQEGAKDFRTQITKVLSARPHALFAPTYGIEGGLLLKQFKELGGKIPVFGADVWSSPELLTSAGKAAEGVFLTLPAKPTGAKYGEFARNYKSKYGREPDVYAAYSYDMAKIIAYGLTTGNTTGPQMEKYLRNMPPYQGVTGRTLFDKNGDCNTKTFTKEQIVGRKYAIIR